MSVAKKEPEVVEDDREFAPNGEMSAEGLDSEQLLDELQPGTVLLHGQYTITKFLNNGGFGITYLAKDSLDRDVVIKECFPGAFCRRTNTIVKARSRAHQGELKSIIRLFVQEARSLSNLEHPNIVGVHQIFEDNDTAYMAIDFVDGKDLLEIIDSDDKSLSPDEIVGVTRKLLEAIGFVHSHDILHRDISPDNILIDSTGEPILIDFGAAREHATNTNRALSALRVVKDGYSPQEFYIAGGEQGPWSDLYSFAASLYHAISQEAPVNGQQRLAALAEQKEDPYKKLAGRFPGYPAGFLEAIDKAMNAMPDKRMRSAADWLAYLDDAQAQGSDAQPATENEAKYDPAIEASIKTIIQASVDDQDDVEADNLEESAENVVASIAAKPVEAEPASTAPIEPAMAAAIQDKPRSRALLMAGVSLVVLASVAGYVMLQSDSAQPVAQELQAEVAATAVTDDATEATDNAVDDTTIVAALNSEDTDVAVGADTVEAVTDVATEGAAEPVEEGVAAAIAEAETDAPTVETAGAVEEPAEVTAMITEAIPEADEVAAIEEEEVAGIATEVEAETVTAAETEVVTAAVVLTETQLPQPIASQQITLSVWDVVMPFDVSLQRVRSAETALITQIDPDADLGIAGDWIREGTVIYAVNEVPLDGKSGVASLILNGLNVDPDGYARAGVRFKDAGTQRFERGLLTVQVVRDVWLADGTNIRFSQVEGKWIAEVHAVGVNTSGSIQKGDILLMETVTGTKIDTPEDLESIYSKLVENEIEAARFEVRRNDTTSVAELFLARGQS